MGHARSSCPAPLRAALRDFGWFYGLFALAVSAPSLLSLLQAILDHRLVDALQWIVDGYDRIAAAMASVLEPVLAPVVAWVNETFRVNYALHAHWRPVFILTMVFMTSFLRIGSSEADPDPAARALFIALWAPGLLLISMLVALNVGLIPLASGWWAQARIAGFTVATIVGVFALLGVTGDSADTAGGKSAFARDAGGLLVALLLGGLAGAVAGALSLHPMFARGAGVIAIALFICLLSAYLLFDGTARPHAAHARAKLRLGLTMLGGFATACLILAADWLLRALGA